MSAAPLLERLQRVTKHGTDRFRAICPAHDSKNRTQSLAIREMPDGTVLIKCFAGCGAIDIVSALGLELSSLFPEKPEARSSGRSGHWHALREAIHTLHHEVLVCAIAAEEIAAGKSLSVEDKKRVSDCAGLIRAAIEACI